MFCPNCGTLTQDNASFCENCGAPLKQPLSAPAVNQESFQTGSNPSPQTFGIQSRSIVAAILLSFVTCGIYGIYWMIKLNDEINQLAHEPDATSGGMVFLFTLLTCGIYGLYWQYKMGERVDCIKGSHGNSGILFLLLSLFGFGIIGYCLMQDAINKAVHN